MSVAYLLIALYSLLATSPAHADCANPAAVAGKVVYNGSYNVPQYCDGTDWIAFGPANAGAGSGGCSNPTGAEGKLIFNDDGALQYCDGAAWQQVGQGYTGPVAPTSGLTHHWTLDETSGTNANDSGSGNSDGTVTGGGTWTAGQIGGALQLNGTDGYVDILTPPIGNGAATFSAWIYPTDLGGYYTIAAENDSGTGTVFICTLAADDAIHCDNQVLAGADAFTSSTIPINQWTHFAVTRASDGVTYNLYINGVLDGAANQVVTPAASAAGDYFLLGSRSSEFFEGNIDDARVYNRVLGAAEVLNLYLATGGSPPDIATGLVGHWTFDETSGTNADDSSSNDNDGTLQNGAAFAPTSGQLGGAVSLSGGSNQNVTMASPTALDNIELQGGGGMTISGWYNVNDLSSDGYVLANKSDETSNGWGAYIANYGSPLFFLFYRDYATQDLEAYFIECPVGTDIPSGAGEWKHYAFAWDGSATAANVKLWIDGVDCGVPDATWNGTGAKPSDAASDFCIGCDHGWEEFPGLIDDIRVYNRVLNGAEVAALYDLGAPGSCATPTALEGTMIYNGSKFVMEYCNGAQWVAIGKAPEDVPCTASAENFTSAGSTTTSVPAGCETMTVEGWGAGGGGGFSGTVANRSGGGGGGGSGVAISSTVLLAAVGGGGGGAGTAASGSQGGGGGGYAKADFAVSEGATVDVYVGGGGASGCTAAAAGNGGAPGGSNGANNATPGAPSTAFGGGGGNGESGGGATNGGSTTHGGGGGDVGSGTRGTASSSGGDGGNDNGATVPQGGGTYFDASGTNTTSTSGTDGAAGSGGGGTGGGGASGGGFTAGGGVNGNTCGSNGGGGRVRITWGD